MTPRMTAVAAAVAAGLAMWLAHPAWGIWPLAFLVPALLATAITASDLPPWVPGMLTGLVANVILLHWLRFRATIVGWLLLALVMAAWFALLATLLARMLDHTVLIGLAPLVWVGIDAVRNTWPFGGFGWASLGITQVGNGWLLPVGRVLGEKGYTFVVVALSLWAWVAVRDALSARRSALDHDGASGDDGPGADAVVGDDGTGGEPAAQLLPVGPAGRAAAATMGDAGWRGTAGVVITMVVVTLVTVGPPAEVGSLDVAAIQPNDVEVPTISYTDITRRLSGQALARTEQVIAADGPAELVVWPEGTVGRDPARDPRLAAAIDAAAIANGGGLLVGTDLEDPDSDGFRRVSLVVGPDGAVTDTYVKQKLVAFGEFVPLRWLFDWYPALDQVSRDAIPGVAADHVVVETPTGRTIPVAVAICFETIAPRLLARNIAAGSQPAQLVVSSTSDATFGRTGEPAQHLDQARMRAIESGRWVVHAAVSGTTAFVDPTGTVRAGGTDLYTVDSVRADVGLVDDATTFLALRDPLHWPSILAVFVAILAVLAGHLRRRRGHGSGDATAGEASP